MDQIVGQPSPAVGTAPVTGNGPRPWGFFGTILWAALALGVWFATQLGIVIAYLVWKALLEPGYVPDLQKLSTDAGVLSLVTFVATPAGVAIFALAARVRRWRVRDYLALSFVRRSELVFAVACLAAFLFASDMLTLLLGRNLVPPFMVDAYISARATGTLPLLVLAVVVVAPIGEELAFRGFLFRGLAASRVGIIGAVLITSVGWALMHVQYDWYIITQIFCIGLLFGWVRWATGSSLVTTVLHVLANMVATIQVAIKVEWLS